MATEARRKSNAPFGRRTISVASRKKRHLALAGLDATCRSEFNHFRTEEHRKTRESNEGGLRCPLVMLPVFDVLGLASFGTRDPAFCTCGPGATKGAFNPGHLIAFVNSCEPT